VYFSQAQAFHAWRKLIIAIIFKKTRGSGMNAAIISLRILPNYSFFD
jgi:hypothetical protein